ARRAKKLLRRAVAIRPVCGRLAELAAGGRVFLAELRCRPKGRHVGERTLAELPAGARPHGGGREEPLGDSESDLPLCELRRRSEVCKERSARPARFERRLFGRRIKRITMFRASSDRRSES